MSGSLPTLHTSAVAELASLRQWVCWKTIERNGKPTKVPFNPKTEGFAKVSLPSTWGTYQEAMQAWQMSDKYSGIGFVLTKADPFVFVDLDKCVDDDGTTEAWATEIINDLDSWTELSPSGRGYHIILRGHVPPGGNRRGQYECYDGGRYFTITGTTHDGRDQIKARQDALDAVHKGIFDDEASPDASPSTPIHSDKLADMSAKIRPLLDPNAEPPTEKLDLVFEVADVIRQTWTRKRSEKKCSEWSASEWDQSLATQLITAGWSLEDVIATLIAYRRRHSDDPKLRDDYYARTILRALNEREFDDAISGLSPESTEGMAPDAARSKIIDSLTTVLKVPILKVIELPTEPRKQYQIVTAKGKIIGEINMLTDHTIFKRAMAETTGIIINRFKANVWDEIVQRLLDIREVGVVAEEATEAGQVRLWLEGFIVRHKPQAEFSVSSVEAGHPFFNSDDLYIQISPFLEYLKKYQGAIVTAKRMSNMLRELGAHSMQKRFPELDGGFQQRRVYMLPPEFVALAKGLPDT